MIRRKLEELAIYGLQEASSYIEITLLRNLFIEKTSDIVYFILNDKLYGIVCLGDFLNHVHNGVVKIVTNFTRLRGFHDEEAREIFYEKDNVQKIPVISAEGELLGDYSRWNEAKKPWIEWMMGQKAVWNRLRKYLSGGTGGGYHKTYILEAARDKEWIREKIAQMLLSTKVEVIKIPKRQLRDLMQEQHKCLVLVTDSDEYRGIECLGCIDGIDYQKANARLDWITVSDLFERLNEYDRQERTARYSISNEGEESCNLLKKLQEQGVRLLLIYNNPYYKSEYMKEFVKKNLEYRRAYPINDEEFWPVETEVGKKFFGELLLEKDYANGTAQQEIICGNKMHRIVDASYESRYYNILEGKRKTCYQPERYYRKVYFFGPCFVMGVHQEDKYTVASWLQKILCEEGYLYRVENCGSYENSFIVMQKAAFQKDDVVVIWTGGNGYGGIDSIELKQLYEQNNVLPEWCLNAIGHINHKVTKLVADGIYCRIKGDLKRNAVEEVIDGAKNQNIYFKVENYNDILGSYMQTIYVNKYFAKAQIDTKKGCIVSDLNMNPMSLQKYMDDILKYVDQFIIFVPYGIAKAKYSFIEYISLLERMFGENSSVIIVSGDTFVPHLDFFQTYYTGDRLIRQQAEQETQIFAQCIAKPLNIVVRFVLRDDEPKISLYNEILKTVLPVFGIEYTELY